MTRWKLVVAAIPAAVALTSCGNANSGVAARVGDRVISEGRLAGLVDRSLADTEFRATVGNNRSGYLRAKLSSLIQVSLLEEAARRLGVTVTDADVTRRYDEFVRDIGSVEELEARAAQQGVAKADLRAAIRETVLAEAVGDKLVEDVEVPRDDLRKAYRENIAEFEGAVVAHILVRDRKTADRVLARVRAGDDFAALAKEFSTDDQTKQVGGDLGYQGRGATDPAFERVMLGTPEGEVGGPVQTRFGWHLLKVTERRQIGFEAATPELRRRLLAQRAEQARNELLTEIAGELRIRINPRFGRWDRENHQVVPPEDDVSAPVSPRPGLPVDGGQSPEPAPSP